jgi:integrase
MSKGRGAGEGSIYRVKGRSLWAARLTVGYSDAGRRRRRTLYARTRSEVAEKLAKVQGEALTGMLSEPGRLTVGAFLDRWLADTVKSTRRVTTFYTYRSFVRTHLKPRIGGLALSRLRPVHVQALVAAMERDGIQPRLRQAVFVTLRAALGDAVRFKLLGSNPAAAIERPRAAQPAIVPLSVEQVDRLLASAREMDVERDAWRSRRKAPARSRLSIEALVALALGSGARQGELFGLRWGDFDAELGTLSIARTIVNVNGRPEVGEGKTAASRRALDLPAFAVLALLKHRGHQPVTPHPSAWIFADWNGRPLRRQNFTKRTWTPLVARAELPRLRFHDLRHSCASFLLQRGVHPRVAQQMLGHADVATTLSTYSHVARGLGKAAAAELDQLLGKRSPLC